MIVSPKITGNVFQETSTSLHEAVRTDEIELVEVLLGLGADPNAKGDKEVSTRTCLCLVQAEQRLPVQEFNHPLHAAAANGNVEIINVLLDHGASVNAEDHRGWTALFFACQDGHLPAIRLLLQRGADIHARTSTGVSCLMVAVKTENPTVVQFLIGRGAKLEAAEEDGWRALHFCAAASHTLSAKILLANGACVDARTAVEESFIFCMVCHVTVFRME